LIDELVREGARRMLAEALQAEVDDYIARFTRRTRRERSPVGGAQLLAEDAVQPDADVREQPCHTADA
jgi:hypothetical protein